MFTSRIRTDGITSYIPEIPGAVSQGKTKEEAREMVLDALNEMMASLSNHHATICRQMSLKLIQLH